MKTMRTVRDVMTSPAIAVPSDAPLTTVAALLAEHRIGGLPVVEGGAVVGLISESDLLVKEAETTDADPPRFRLPTPGTRHALAMRAAVTAGQAMSSPAVTIAPERPIGAAARLMVERRLGRLPVVEAGRLVGIVTRGDLVRTYARSDADLVELVRHDILLETMWLDPARFEVSAQDGVVAIRGHLESRTTADVLQRLIAHTPGVVAVEADLDWAIDDRRPPELPPLDLMGGFPPH